MTLHVFCFNSHKCIALSLILATVFVTDSRGHCPHGCVCSPNSRHAQLNHLSCAHANADDIRPSQHTHSLNYKSVFTSYIDASHFPTEPNNLIFLSWTDSGIKSIKSNALQYLINLRSLNLSNNDITTLNNALRHLDNLQSLNLTNNKLKRLSYFDIPEASLESLFLANNLLYDDCFLRGEQSDGVCLESPRPRKKLSSLDLSTNSLSEFHGYPHCENLVELDLSFNRISFISEVFLVNLFRLNRLDISHNALKRLLQPMLKNAVLLERLDASDNEVTEISENFFRNLESLRILNLSNNPIQTLPSRGFQNCHWLHTLSIDNSSISYVPHDFFYGLEELTDLSLKHNKFLSFIPENSFAYSTHLEYLDLRSNNLTVLPKSISLLSKLKRIFLYGNPISCNCSLAWYVGWQERYSIENDHNSTICSHLFNETKSQNFSCIETPILPRLMFELGRAAMLDCGHAIRGSNISWVSPSGLHYNSFISIWNTKSALDVPTIDDSRIKLLENGSLYIKHILRGDCGLYICRVNDAFLNYSSYFVVQLDPITYYRIKIQSIVVGLGSAFGFLAITIVVQIIRKLCKRFGCCASDNEDEDDDDKEGNQLPQVLESIEQYKTQQLERLRENYTIQAHKIKENCVTQVEWICDSYQNQVKNLKDFRDYGTSHISSMKEQYYEQVKRVKEYSNGQLTWVRENYVFQRNRVRKFSSHKVLRFRESYKYQQQALNKVLENLPSLHLDNCRSGSCSKEGDAPTEAEDPDFEVYIKTAGSSIIHPLTIFEDSNECQSVYYTPSEFSESPMTPARDKSSRKLSLIPDLIKSDERVLERKIYSAIPKCNNDISRVGRSHDRRSTDMSNVHVRIAPLRASSMPEIKKSSEQTPLVDQADIFYESNCDNGEVSPVKVRNETAL